jgi:excisionase family DNA binding protein
MIEQKIHADRLLTSHEVGDLLQVNPSSVKKWVNEGRIAAFRTPGGHRRIRVADLVEFLNRHAMPIPRPLAGGVEAAAPHRR